MGSAPQAPRDLSHQRQSRRAKTETGHPERCSGVPSPVLAPGTALGSRLRVALSSGQVTDHSICDPSAEPLTVRAASDTDRCRSPSALFDHSTDRQPVSGLSADVSQVGPSVPDAFYAILGGRLSGSHPFIMVGPPQRPIAGMSPESPATHNFWLTGLGSIRIPKTKKQERRLTQRTLSGRCHPLGDRAGQVDLAGTSWQFRSCVRFWRHVLPL